MTATKTLLKAPVRTMPTMQLLPSDHVHVLWHWRIYRQPNYDPTKCANTDGHASSSRLRAKTGIQRSELQSYPRKPATSERDSYPSGNNSLTALHHTRRSTFAERRRRRSNSTSGNPEGLIWLSLELWKDPNPLVQCFFRCTLVLPSYPPFTTTLDYPRITATESGTQNKH